MSFLGVDRSGNSNNWTTNNLASTDQMLDSPTNNFATLNPLDWYGESNRDRIRFKEGNLWSYCTDTCHNRTPATMGVSSGKFYWEVLMWSTSAHFWQDQKASVVQLEGYSGDSNEPGRFVSNGVTYIPNGNIYSGGNSGSQSYGDSYTKGDIIGVSLDMDNGKVWFSKNGVWQNSGNPVTGVNAAYDALLTDGNIFAPMAYLSYNDSVEVFNFGQDSSFAGNKTAQGNTDDNGYGDFYYEPPTGFNALCTQNLDDPDVIPSEHFNTVLYTGNGGTQSITGVGFQPDWVWAKSRSATDTHVLTDAVRGIQKAIVSNSTGAEYTDPTGLTSFNSNGFSIGSASRWNTSSRTYVAWNWKANGSGVSNTDGTITSTVSANTDAGFSIVSYTGTDTNNATVGHGLSKAPEFVIYKNRSATASWEVYEASTDNRYQLDNTSAGLDDFDINYGTNPSATVVNLAAVAGVNRSPDTYIMYCFHSVDGYSKVGSYTGNGSSDGTFVYTGFRPAYVMVKCTTSGEHWWVQDSTRDTYNVVNHHIRPDTTDTEQVNNSNLYLDFTSNGFKFRSTNEAMNYSGYDYIYLAFAEHPFKHTNAR